MRLSDLTGKNANICILGFGKEGQAMLDVLKKHAPDAAVFLADANPAFTHPDYPVIAGADYLNEVDAKNFTAIIKSPGVKPTGLIEMWRQQEKLSSGTELFLEEARAVGALVIGVTGSKGKSTTSSLIYAMLSRSPQLETRSFLVGNIGIPSISYIDKITKDAVFVMEMSSYQLMDVTVSPQIAVVTSFFPDHLDYHGSLEAYREAKANIARFQQPEDTILYAKDSPGAAWIARQSMGERVGFLPEDCPVAISATKLIGEHNRSNIAGAFMAAMLAGADQTQAIAAIQAFEPLPHRLQSLGVHHGIEWVDDAISTTPESTIAALDALGDRVATIILGGQDRGYDFTPLADRLAVSSIKTAILFPGSGPAIRKAIEASGAQINLIDVDTMEQAVTSAKKLAMSNLQLGIPIVLLSTASPSYNMYRNFEEKGDTFRKCILALGSQK